MTDNLIFPIDFDLEKGVKDAQGQMDSVLRRLQKTLDGKPLTIPMSLDPSKFTTFESALRGSIQHITDDAKALKATLDSSLQTDNSANINRITEAMRNLEVAWKALPNNQKFDINDRLTPKAQEMVRQFNELATASSTYGQTLSQIAGKIKRVAEEEAKANQKRNDGYAKLRKTLGAQENSIANLSAKIKAYQQILNSKEIGSRSFERVAEKIRKLSEKLDVARAKINALTKTAVSSNAKHAQSVNHVTQEYQRQDGYVSRLLNRLAVYASFSYASQFLTSIREVTAQFELQRVSLGAIIQDTSRANQLWSEIKTFALKSPVKILDLTKYTKQVAAYGVETDKLFDTTKRIMDISVGLGVDASRLVLAYGQVKAASYLRAAEIRQFTEAGIPMLELLAEKFTELNGKAVTTEQVMDMVSKRMVGFDMVEQIFKDMTSAGGMFFDMQEKQGNTLYGLWAKLGDAASIMYDEIGNTGSVNSVMKDSIQFLTDLMKNWRLVGREMIVAAGTFLLLRANTVLTAQGTALATKATNDYATATTRLNAAQKRGAQTAAYAASLSKKAAVLNRAASISTNAWTAATLRLQAAMYSLKAAFIGNWVTLAIAAVAAIGAALYSAYEKAHKLQNELKEIRDAGQAESAKSVFNFERLANAALETATGSREQKEALDELKRTYGDIIPVEQLSLESLQKLRAQGYEPLTAAIKEYIAQRTLQKEIDTITSHYTEDTIAKQRQLRELFKRGSIDSFFKGVAWSPIENLDDDQISQVFANVDKIARDKSKSWEDVWIEAIKSVTDVSEDAERKMRAMFVSKTQNAQQQSYNSQMRDIVENTRNMADETDTATQKMEVQTGLFRKYNQRLDETSKSLANIRLVWSNDKEVDPSSFLGKQMISNASIKAWKDDIVENLQDAGIAIKNEWFNIITNLNPKDPSKISSINFDPILDAVDAAKDKLGDDYVQLRNSIVKYQELYDGIVPSDRTVLAMRSRLMQIASNIDKTGRIMNDLQRHLMKSGDNWANYSKSVRDAVQDYEAQIDEMKKINASIKKGERGVGPIDPSQYSDEEIKKVQLLVEALKQLFPFLAPVKSSGSGRTSDPRLQTLQEIANKMAEVNKEYDELLKKEGQTKALADTQKLFASSFEQMQATAKKYKFKLPTFEVPQTIEDVQKWYKAIADEIKRLKLKNADKILIELGFKSDKAAIDKQQKDIEAELKRLSDRISRTKTAKEFYEKILGMTGDYDLAAKVSLSIYGDTGYDLQKQLAAQVRQYFQNDQVSIEIPLDVITADNQINYKRLGEFAEQMKKQLGEEPYKAIKKIAEEGQTDLAKTYEGYLKDLEKAKTYADKRIELARTTAAKIREIESNPQYTKEQKAELKRGYQEREEREAAKLEYEAFKDTPLYVQMFEDLEQASTSTLEMMKSRLEALSGVWGTALDPTQLKEIQSRMNEIDAQLRTRNPFKTLKESYQQYRDAVKNVSVEGAAETAAAASTTFYERAKMYGADSAQARAAEKELKAREKILEISRQLVDANGKRLKGQDALNAAARKSFDLEANRRVELEMASAEETALRKESKYDDPNKDPEVIAAHEAVEKAKEEWELAKLVSEILQENAKRSKTLKENIVAAAGESVQFLQAGASVASAIADTMEALGADELDVQYFRDIAEGMGNIAAGVDGLVQSIMAGSISGAISNAIGIIPNMVKGFSQIFNAGKIRKANKEIERQQEILDRLEYTYSRLEKAADSLFGADYISNYNAQMKNLQAQQTAYLRMAEAERSKGKDADDAKISEYTNAARDAADKIQDMRNELTSKFLGTDRASAAREFAESWLEAKATFASTTDAIQSKYKDMLKSMIVEGAAAKVIDNILAPMWDNMNAMLKKSNIQGAMDYLASNMDGFLQAADSGLNALWATLEARGYDMQKLLGETSDGPTGIAHDIATASEESINGLAAGINTQNFYIAQQLQEVQRIRAIVEAGLQGSSKPSDSSNLLLMQEQAMNHYAAIEANTAATVARLDSVVRMLEGVITPRGTKGARGIQVWT